MIVSARITMSACERALALRNATLNQTTEPDCLTAGTSPDRLRGRRSGSPSGPVNLAQGSRVHQRRSTLHPDVTAGLLCPAPAFTTLIQLFFLPMRRIHSLLSGRSIPSISKARLRESETMVTTLRRVAWLFVLAACQKASPAAPPPPQVTVVTVEPQEVPAKFEWVA